MGVRGGGGHGEVAVAVHGGYGHAEGVVLVIAQDVAGDVPVVGGHHICPAVVHGLPGAAGREPGIPGEFAQQVAGLQEGIRIGVQHELNLDILHIRLGDLLGDGGDHAVGVGGAGIHAQRPAGLHPLGHFFGGGQLGIINRFVICHILVSFFLIFRVIKSVSGRDSRRYFSAICTTVWG